MHLYPWIYTTHTHMEVSINGGTPKSSILIGFSIINQPFWGNPIVSQAFWGSPPFVEPPIFILRIHGLHQWMSFRSKEEVQEVNFDDPAERSAPSGDDR